MEDEGGGGGGGGRAGGERGQVLGEGSEESNLAIWWIKKHLFPLAPWQQDGRESQCSPANDKKLASDVSFRPANEVHR